MLNVGRKRCVKSKEFWWLFVLFFLPNNYYFFPNQNSKFCSFSASNFKSISVFYILLRVIMISF